MFPPSLLHLHHREGSLVDPQMRASNEHIPMCTFREQEDDHAIRHFSPSSLIISQ